MEAAGEAARGRARHRRGLKPRGSAWVGAPQCRRGRTSPSPPPARAAPSCVGAGSFGTATAVLLARGGFRTTLQTRTPEQAAAAGGRPRERGLPARASSCRATCAIEHDGRRARARRLRVPRRPLARARRGDRRPAARRADRRTPVISLAKGLVAARRHRADACCSAPRSAPTAWRCVGGPAHAREMVTEGAGLVAASTDERLAAHDRQRLHARRRGLRAVQRPGRRRARRRRPRTPPRWPRARPRRRASTPRAPPPGHIFLEVWRYAERQGARPESMIGLAGHRRPRRHRARAAEPQPARGRAARPGRARRGDPGAHRPGRRGARHGPAAGQRARRAPAIDAPVTPRARPPDRRRAAAGRVGRAGARHRPAAGRASARAGTWERLLGRAALVVARRAQAAAPGTRT